VFVGRQFRATGVRCTDVDAESSAGGIQLDCVTPPQRLRAVSSAGGVEVVVPDEPCRVDARTSAGQTIVGVVNDPRASRTITAQSSAGSVSVRRR